MKEDKQDEIFKFFKKLGILYIVVNIIVGLPALCLLFFIMYIFGSLFWLITFGS